MLTHLKKSVQKLSFLLPFPPDMSGTWRTNLHPSGCDICKELLQLSGFQCSELPKVRLWRYKMDSSLHWSFQHCSWTLIFGEFNQNQGKMYPAFTSWCCHPSVTDWGWGKGINSCPSNFLSFLSLISDFKLFPPCRHMGWSTIWTLKLRISENSLDYQFNSPLEWSQADDGSKGSSRELQELPEEVNSRAWNLSHISWFHSKCLNHDIILQPWDTTRTFNPRAGTSWSIFHHFYSRGGFQAGTGSWSGCSGLEEPSPVWDLSPFWVYSQNWAFHRALHLFLPQLG